MVNYFELEIKTKLEWTFKQWQEAGVKAKGFKRLINSLKYWNVRLRSAMTELNVILTLHNEENRAYPSLQRIVEDLHILNSQIKISGYAKFRNRRFISISFDNLEEKEFVTNNFLEIDSSKIAYLHWVDEALQQSIVVDWLSNHTDLDLVVHFIEQYMNIQSCQREITSLVNGDTCVSGKVVLGQIKQGINIDSIPYIALIDNLECLIAIEGRPYQCFTCSKFGHKAINCQKFFCKKCNIVHDKVFVCNLSNSHATPLDYSSTNISYLNGMDVENNVTGIYSEGIVKNDSIVKNLFQDNKLNLVSDFFSETCALEEMISPMSIDNCVYPGNSIKENIKMENNDYFLPRTFKNQEGDSLKSNRYITEELKLGDPNFILVDTSTDESDDSEDNSKFLIDKAETWMLDLQQKVDVSRSLCEQSMFPVGSNKSLMNGAGASIIDSPILSTNFLFNNQDNVDLSFESQNTAQLNKKKNSKKKEKKKKVKSKTIT